MLWLLDFINKLFTYTLGDMAHCKADCKFAEQRPMTNLLFTFVVTQCTYCVDMYICTAQFLICHWVLNNSV